ncbi:hypothetical protein DFA_10067 [Cavenderia fasciculata]|uniref:Uncharacterized protein n=1 Tax=Cavenderia fasciculata TaxID=261658 RepID=F4Q966_CACFS|nr:uncharacterized protein DFA_10067 [Cavenderia fasciculata]EGG15235.1 hypothetical protein DFA_10067 [Cavenderia fasciculata]|eukprot:XP_004351955.1 hypothetical protein DFA_10067 [Cavenderia fasciculata]
MAMMLIHNNNNNNNNKKKKNSKDDSNDNNNNSKKGPLEEAIEEKIRIITEKDFQVEYIQRVSDRYDQLVNTMIPDLIESFTILEKNWNLVNFINNPDELINKLDFDKDGATSFEIHHYIDPKDIKSINQLSKFIEGKLFTISISLSELYTMLQVICPSMDQTDSHSKILIAALVSNLVGYAKGYVDGFNVLEPLAVRKSPIYKIQKHKEIKDLESLENEFKYKRIALCCSYTKRILASLYCLLNFLQKNQSNFDEIKIQTNKAR